MKGKHIFIDTNILLYAHDSSAGWKKDKASALLKSVWESPYPPAVSVQVLQEFYVNLLRFSVSADRAKKIIENFLVWEVIENNTTLLFEGIQCSDRWKISFWDGLIVAAAKKAKADIIWSEDFQTGVNFDGIKVVNPIGTY